MVEKIVQYKIERNVASSIRKVLSKISDTEFMENFELSDQEISCIHLYLDNVDIEEDEVMLNEKEKSI